MIIIGLDGSMPFYRAHTPKWASQPLSGAGAALHGGRLNRPGIHALYLADSPALAVAESTQGDPLMPPLTLTSYRVKLTSVVDFRDGYSPGTWHPIWQDLTGNWRGEALLDGIEPASWSIGDLVIDAGHTGVLFRSVRAAGINLVIYTDRLSAEDRLTVHDPDARLPRDQSSWSPATKT